MKRAVLLGSLAMALTAALACHPKEPKQASGADPVTEEPSSSSGGSSSGGSGGSSSGGSKPSDPVAPPPGPAGKASKGEPTPVSSLASMMDGLRWGMSHADVTKTFTENGGIIW